MQPRNEPTRSAILHAAERLFSRLGYDATGVAEICAEAHASKGAFYHHFPSKQAVFLTLLQDWLSGIETRLEAILLQGNPVPQTLLEMSAMLKDVLPEAEGRLPMFLEFWTQAQRDPLFWQATIAPYRRFHAFFTSVLQAGIENGVLRRIDASTAARVLVAMAMGILLQAQLDPQSADWSQIAREGMGFLMEGMLAPPEPCIPDGEAGTSAEPDERAPA